MRVDWPPHWFRRRRSRRPAPIAYSLQSRAAARSGRAVIVRAIATALAALCAAAWLAVWGFARIEAALFSRNPMFTIARLDMSSDGRLTPELLQRYARVSPGENLFAVDPQRIRNELLSIPAVRDIAVRRRLPDTLEVRVVERTALAKIPMPGTDLLLTVDVDGWVLVAEPASASLPLLSGFSFPGLRPGIQVVTPEIRDALRILDACASDPALRSVSILEIRRADTEHLLLRLEGGEEALLPRRHIDRRLAELPDVLRNVRGRRRAAGGVVRIDMTGEINHCVTGLLP